MPDLFPLFVYEGKEPGRRKAMALNGRMDRRTRDKKGFLTAVFILSFFSLVASYVGIFLFGGGDVETFSRVGIFSMGKFIFTDPAFSLSEGLTGLYIGCLIFLIGFCYIYLDYERKKNSRMEEEYGSSKLLTAKELPRFKQLFFYDPKIVEECRKKRLDEKNEKRRQKEKKEKKLRPLKTYYDRDELKTVCKKIPRGKDTELQCFLNSQIMGEDVFLSMNTKFLNRNLNTITIGGSGQGKSYSELFPNALMGTCNYVFTDPSGEILSKIGHFLQDIKDYKIKVFNIDDFSKSMRYNPLLYAKTEKDINILVDALNRNIKPAKKGTSNEFFDDAKDSLMCALIALLKELYPTEGDMDEKTRKKNMKRQTLKNVMRLLLLAEQECLEEGGDGISATSTLDAIFDRLLEHNPRSYAAASWKSFKVGGPKVCNEVIISACAVYSRYFNTDAMEDLTCEDELDLYELAKDEPCALFIVTPSSDTSYNFMASMIYTQLFSIVTSEGKRHAEENNLSDPALPRHLSFWLDEFSNTGKIPQFLELLSVVRKYNISINVIVQGLSQLRGMYKDSWETIIANMDTMIYLGGQEPDTIKMMSEKLGKETIKGHNYTLSKRNGDSTGYKNMARSLLTPDEIARMVRSHELVFITGCKPIQTRKYDLKKHPNYRYCGEYSRKNNFDLYYLIGDRSIDLTALDEAAITEEEIRSYKFE